MRARAHQIDVALPRVAVVRTEPGTLREDGFEGERRPQVGIQLVLKVSRREDAAGDQILAQPRDVVFFEVVENALPITRPFDRPIDWRIAQVRHRRQHVVAGAARWRKAWVGHARRMQVQGKILGQGLTLENLLDKRSITRPGAHGVVLQLRLHALEPEVDDKQRVAEAHAFEADAFLLPP